MWISIFRLCLCGRCVELKHWVCDEYRTSMLALHSLLFIAFFTLLSTRQFGLLVFIVAGSVWAPLTLRRAHVGSKGPTQPNSIQAKKARRWRYWADPQGLYRFSQCLAPKMIQMHQAMIDISPTRYSTASVHLSRD